MVRILIAMFVASTMTLLRPGSALAADLIVNTGTPTQTNGATALLVDQQIAFKFKLNTDYNITLLQAWISGSSNYINYVVYSDRYDLPDQQIYSFGYTTPGGASAWVGPTLPPIYRLDAGTYWLALEPKSEYGYGLSMLSGAPSPLAEAISFTSPPSYSTYPLPGHGLRIFGEAVGAVPEPAIWAMLIAGFGAAGAAARRSHRKGETLKLT